MRKLRLINFQNQNKSEKDKIIKSLEKEALLNTSNNISVSSFAELAKVLGGKK